MNQLPAYLREENGELWLTEDERDNLKVKYRIKKILHSEQSPFQHVLVLDSYDFGPMLVLDGAVQTTSLDGYIYNEMIAHVPMNLHPNPKKVLIIGGGDCGVAKEIAKYPEVEQIDMVEIDELVVQVSKQYLPEVSGNLTDPRVHFIYQDGVKFAQEKENTYDVIIVDSSDPVGPAVALFAESFYQSLHRALKSDGLMVCQSQSPIFHADVMKQSYTRIARTFPITKMYTAVVPTYPGGLWSFTLGSKQYDQLQSNRPFTKATQYVNEAILARCFDLPQFLVDLLQS